jgi:two-component system cell cycle response regulator
VGAMETVDIWMAGESPALASLSTAMAAEGLLLAVGGGQPAQVRAVVVDASSPNPASLAALLTALQARRVGRSALVMVLVADVGAGRHWLAEGADDFALDGDELCSRLVARLRRPSRPDAVNGAITLRAAAELALGEVERTAGTTDVELILPGRGGEPRVFSRAAGLLVESGITDHGLMALALSTPGVRLYTLSSTDLPEAVATRLAERGAEALITLGLVHDGRPLGAAVAPLSGIPGAATLEAVSALAPALANALRGAVTVEEAYLGRYRELLESNRRLRELNHAKDEFLAVCSHDLRSPLSALTSHAQLIASGVRGELSGPVRAGVDSILRQARKMAELIHTLLAERALETGTLELQRGPTDLAALLAESVEEALPAAQEKGLALLTEGLTLGGPEFDVDPARLREAVGNLIANAIKYTPPGGRVELSLARDATGTTIGLRDNGPGIAPDELPNLFDRYRRGRAGRANGEGTGLGLSWAREVVRMHGGTLGVQSALGQGTRFTIRLPVMSEVAELATTSDRSRVLVVEDDTDVREVMVELLRERFDVLEATNGEDGVRLAKADRPDVVLMDLFMPQLDGFAALEDLRRDPRTAETPVIFLSGSSDEQVKLRVLDLGAADYLVKPFSPRELVARVDKALKAAQQRRSIAALAQIDALTGLPNYGAFRTRLDEEMKRAGRYRTPLAAVMIDLDRLKQLNDVHGHELGNRAILALADHIRANLRTSDFAARFGGDEFVVLLPHTRPEEALHFAERVRAGLAELRLPTAQGAVSLQASLGVAALPMDGSLSAEEALRGADAALYAAKRAGRDRVCVAPPPGAVNEVAHP